MHNGIRKFLLHSSMFLILILFDYTLGKKILYSFTEVMQYMRRYFSENTFFIESPAFEQPISVNDILSKLIVFGIAMSMLRWLRNVRNKDEIDELLQERKTILDEANKLLEKWQHTQTSNSMELEMRKLSLLRLELPLLQMALFDPSVQKQYHEGGDTGNLGERMESTFLSFSPLLDENMDELLQENVLLSHAE